MGLHTDEAIAIARRTPVSTGFPFARESDPRSVIDPRWNGDFQFYPLRHHALSAAGLAGIGDDLPTTSAGGAGGLHAKDPGRLDDLSSPAAATARFASGVGSAAGAAATATGFTAFEFHGPGHTVGRFCQGEDDFALDIGPGADSLATSATTPAKKIAENAAPKNVAEGIKDILDVRETGSTPRSLHSRMPESVVPGTFLPVAQDLVGLGRFLEEVGGFLIAGMAVWMVFDGQLTVSARDLLI
jgi:hypothetical protein